MELRIEHLNKTYGNGVKAINDCNLTIPRGMFGLLGPNGAGKSSLMRTIATLQEADSGSITLGDIDVLKDKDAVRRILGYLPQEFGVYPKVSAENMLDHVASLKGINQRAERKELVAALLHRVNLYDKRKSNLGTFSGGMKQRFGIAQALLGNPQLIIVDEPTAGLDPTERNRFHNLLSEIGENTIVILSTHIVEDVTNLCNDMAIICLGQVIAKGHPAELVREVNGSIWSKSIHKAELPAHLEAHRVISTQLKGGKTEIHVFSESQPDASFHAVNADLEDVYFTRIGERMELELV
ncbi:ABC transporter ATP-binding protein [Neolewinella lacunae]|uniref:ABC transporter ATP-binding protein n=1 Tax=Neolewinella lacunae TaxID=1517758 RepID=A0A923PNI0_9BACT|nr:ABC transporter ATP-binding protein [Neolewinella lacunae]MBC6995675.1 ABC transporter ATP-binding protein [Neolewinella lacunae]MDN3636632.1 ABC transporter ATP-binding protein [Neolewinella lacunae]